MKIIDTHIHLYDFKKGRPGASHMQPLGYGKVCRSEKQGRIAPPSFADCTSSPEILLEYMDWCGVEKGILMSNPYYGYFNGYVKEAVMKNPDRLRGVALVDVLKGRAAADELEKIYQEGVLFGMAFETANTFMAKPEMHLGDSFLEPLWQCMNAYKQPAFIHMFTGTDIEDVEILSEDYPDIKFILCHLGADAVWGANAGPDGLAKLYEIAAGRENVFVDLSSIPDYLDEEYPFPTAVRRIQDAWNKIGAQKMLWASDYPGMLTQATYKQLINLVLKECREIPMRDKELIMGLNAEHLLFEQNEKEEKL